MDVELVQALDLWSDRLGRTRADIIREACRVFLKQLDREESDRAYREGYERHPEQAAIAQTQVALLGQVLSNEGW